MLMSNFGAYYPPTDVPPEEPCEEKTLYSAGFQRHPDPNHRSARRLAPCSKEAIGAAGFRPSPLVLPLVTIQERACPAVVGYVVFPSRSMLLPTVLLITDVCGLVISHQLGDNV